MWCDNHAATILADHEGKFDAVKHIQVRYHVLRDYQKRAEGLLRSSGVLHPTSGPTSSRRTALWRTSSVWPRSFLVSHFNNRMSF